MVPKRFFLYMCICVVRNDEKNNRISIQQFIDSFNRSAPRASDFPKIIFNGFPNAFTNAYKSVTVWIHNK